MKKALTAAITAIIFALSLQPTYAAQRLEPDMPVTNAVYDVILMRPLGVLWIGVGTAAFVIGLPVTIFIGEAGRSAQELVAGPVNFTFTRPIGDMGTLDYQGYPPEGEWIRPEPTVDW